MLKRVISTGKEFGDSIAKDHMGAFAAQSAFFILLSLFPLINIILALIRYLPMTEKDFVDFITNLMPDGGNNIIVGIVGEIYSNSAGTLTIVSLIIGLWSAAKGIMAIRNGLNEVYKAKPKVNFIIQRLISSFYTLIIVIAIIAISFISVFGEQIVKIIKKHFPAAGKVAGLLLDLKGVMIIGVMFLVFTIMFKVLPNRKVKFKNQIGGAMFASLWWMLMSKLFAWYISSYATKNFTYGSLTMVILLMFFLYFGVMAILIGGQINVFLERTDLLRTIFKNDGTRPLLLVIDDDITNKNSVAYKDPARIKNKGRKKNQEKTDTKLNTKTNDKTDKNINEKTNETTTEEASVVKTEDADIDNSIVPEDSL
ncbi:membrane protein [Eubacterium ruminantium]|nr:membrane protein [Eubacterium ruminantium]